MPWSSQSGGGGPWGGGGGNNQGPWGQGPQGPRGGGNRPPDLDEILRRGQERLRGAMPGGGGNSSFIAVIVVIVLVGFWLFQSIYTVQPDQRGVELRFGNPKEEISMPGLHFHWWPFETVEFAPITEEEMNIGGSTTGQNSGLMLTGDQNIVEVDFKVLYAVTDAKAYLFNVANPEDTLQQVSESAMRQVVGRRPAQDIFRDAREEIAEEVKTIIQSTMNEYGAGIAINAVSIEDAAPPPEVADAFDEVQRAEQDEDRFKEEANQYANKQLGQARGEAAQRREAAAAYKEQVINEAQGQSKRFLAVLEAYRQAPDVTRRRMYLETMQKVLDGSSKVVIDPSASANGVVPYLPLPEIKKQQQNQNQAAKGGNQ
jgi:membrane protease subunit HflK